MWQGARLCKVKAATALSAKSQCTYVCDRRELDCVKLKQGERDCSFVLSSSHLDRLTRDLFIQSDYNFPPVFLLELYLYFFYIGFFYFIFNCVCICITPGSAFFFNLITTSLSAPALFHHLWEIHQTALDKYTWSYLRNTKVQLPPFHSIRIPTSIFIISTFENMVKSQESTRYI